MNKLLTTIMLALISIVALAGVASAFQTDYVFREIEVDGTTVFETVNGQGIPTDQPIHVQRGDIVEVRVEFTVTDDGDTTPNEDLSERTRIRTWIGGFEFGDVSDSTDIFTVEEGITYTKKLTLEIPEDIDVEEDEKFRLHVEVFDDSDSEAEETFFLAVRKPRHEVNFVKSGILFFPGNTVQAGRALSVEVRAENLGERKEEEVLVTVRIPELGLTTRGFIDELASTSEGDDNDEETSGSSDRLVLFIPKDAQTGEYLVEVEVEFNRGHDVTTETRTILVEGIEETDEVPESIISVDMTAQNIAQGSEVPYKFMVANLGNERSLYSIGIEGVGAWGTSRVSPAFVSVDEASAGEFFVFIGANQNAPLGQQTFKVNILADGATVRELNLNANILQGAPVVKSTGFENTQRALEIGFIVLVIILVILGLVIAFRRIGASKAETSEPETVGEQTYY